MSRSPVVFDLDGTLIDSLPDIHAAVGRMLAAEGRAPLSLGEVGSFVGDGVAMLIERVADATGVMQADRKAQMLARFRSEYEQRPTELTTVFAGVHDALAELRGRGHALGICTNKPRSIALTILDNLGLGGLFCLVIGGDSLPVRKPDPKPLLATFQGLGAETGLFVGDSEVDAETALAAGATFLLFTEGYRKSRVADIAHRASFEAYARLPVLVGQVI